MTYLTAPPALDRPRCNLTSRQSLQLSECGRPPATAAGADTNPRRQSVAAHQQQQ